MFFSVPLSADINYSSKIPFSVPEGRRWGVGRLSGETMSVNDYELLMKLTPVNKDIFIAHFDA